MSLLIIITLTNYILIIQLLPDPPLPFICLFLLGHSFSAPLLSVHWSTHSEFTNKVMLGCDKGWGIRRGERGHWYLFTQTERLCPGMSRWWIWLALGWHGHIRRKARTPQHSALSLFSPPFHESPFLTFSPLTQCNHSAALIGTTCPHLSACKGGNNMGLVWGWVLGVWMKCTIKDTSVLFCHCELLTLCK